MRMQTPSPQRPHTQNNGPTAGHCPIFAGKFRTDTGPNPAKCGPRQIGIFPPRLFRINEAAQYMDANAEMPFFTPAAGQVQLTFVIRFCRQTPNKLGPQFCFPWPIIPKAAPNHRVQNLDILGQIFGQTGRGAQNVDQQINHLRICAEQRKQLNARRQF